MLKLLMYLGIRVSELVYLKKDDITIDKNIFLRIQLSRNLCICRKYDQQRS